MGHAVAIQPGEAIVAGAPTHGGWEDTTGDRVDVYLAPYVGGRGWDVVWRRIHSEAEFDPHPPPKLGSRVMAPGDVDGDGVQDLLAFGDASDLDAMGSTGFLVAGDPPEPPVVVEVDAVLPIGEALGGTPCGDVTGDGAIDLCLHNGIIAGPVVGKAPLQTTWSATTPADDVRMAGTGEIRPATALRNPLGSVP